jgi:hypothetical protein
MFDEKKVSHIVLAYILAIKNFPLAEELMSTFQLS